MLVNQLFHVAIKTADLEATRRFYVDVLGMTLADRPDLGFPGIWVQSAAPGGMAIFHIYGGEEAHEPGGGVAVGTGAIDHVSITAHGFASTRERLRSHGLAWRENRIPRARLWQIFVHDPSGVLLELTYSAHAEGGDEPDIAAEFQYRARERFFDPIAYQQFASV